MIFAGLVNCNDNMVHNRLISFWPYAGQQQKRRQTGINANFTRYNGSKMLRYASFAMANGMERGSAYPGQSDSPLTAMGEHQARLVAKRVSKEGITASLPAIWGDTRRTAQIIAEAWLLRSDWRSRVCVSCTWGFWKNA